MAGGLRIRHKGQQINEIVLNVEKSYVAGRKDEADIRLQSEKGISRDHFKLIYNGDSWVVQFLSQYYEADHRGSEFPINHGERFKIGNYEFEYVDSERIENSQASMSAKNETEDMDEKTSIISSAFIPYVKVMDSSLGKVNELFRLESGDTWLAGREDSCSIVIRDQRVSRRQFEIFKKGNLFFIRDLGSVNGTIVNGSPLKPKEDAPLKSGDSISILENVMVFELHDPNFKAKIENIRSQGPMQIQVLSPAQENFSYPVPHENHYPDEIIQDRSLVIRPHNELGEQNFESLDELEKFPTLVKKNNSVETLAISKNLLKDKKKRNIAITAIILVLLAIISEFSEDSSTTQVAKVDAFADPFSKLNPEQQSLVRQTHQLAKNYYIQGKYQLALQEAVKLKEIVPEYLDSREIERLALEAMHIQEEQRKQEELERQRLEIEEKILKQVEICKKKINPQVQQADVEDCLSSILQYNPEHPLILQLRAEVEKILSVRAAEEAKSAAYRADVSKLQGQFVQAEKININKEPFVALDLFQKVIKSSLPDPGGLKIRSGEKIALIRRNLSQQTSKYQTEAESFYSAQDLKNAILSLRKARLIDPTNMNLQVKIDSWINELRKQMMVIYQEGILEESFSNVDGSENKLGAKDRWKKILQQDIPDGEYYQKAYIKLKKYGAL